MITWLRKQVGIIGRPRPTNLDAAMIRIANNIRPEDSFCVTEDNWGFRRIPGLHRNFRVSLFYSHDRLVQKEGKVLDEVITAALADYKLKI